MKRKPSLGPRNPHVAPSLFRKAGAHRKSNKAQRARDKQDVRRVAQLAEHSAFTRGVSSSILGAPTTYVQLAEHPPRVLSQLHASPSRAKTNPP